MAPPRAHDLDDLRWRVLDVSEEAVAYQGVLFPERFSARLSHPHWQCEADLHVGVHHDRGPVALGLVVRPSLLTDEGPPTYLEMHDLVRRLVDMGELLRQVTSDAVAWKVSMHLLEKSHDDHPDDPEGRRRAVEDARPVVSAVRDRSYARSEPRRRRLLTESYLREVAQTYRDALAAGDAPTRAVELRYGTSYSNATKLVRKARDMGLLGAATGTRPGEVHP